MPTLSQYWFDSRFFAGPFEVYNVPYWGWAWIANPGPTQATLAWNRQDDEQVFDVGAQANIQPVLDAIDGMLKPKHANRLSGVMAQAVQWSNVPFHERDPRRHGDSDWLIRIYFDFHIHTPWYCTDASGDISYYLVPYLDLAGHLRAYVDWWSYHYDGGGPFCTGHINSLLDSAVPGGMNALQGFLNVALAASLGNSTFHMLYLLPGSGTKVPGEHHENADEDVAIAVLP